MKVIQVLFFLILSVALRSQNKFTLSGYIRDSSSGETMIGANISLTGDARAVSSNAYGFYSITLPAGNYSLTCSYAGYSQKMISVNLDRNIELNVEMRSRSQLTDVVITTRKTDANIKDARMGKVDLSINRIKNIPVLLGEVDILKTIQLLPGIRNAGEGNTGLYVRGGGPDQNLIMLDDAVVYNTGHLFGFFSIFNADAIKNTTLYKGGMPAQYGGRLSSVLDISMKEGNNKKFEVDGGLGLIASRVSVQGPIVKEKSSFIISARRTYIDVLVKPFIPKSSQFYGSGYYFYDLNMKVNYKFSEKDRLYLSGYFGRDVFDFRNSRRSFEANIPWGNSTATLRWNHVFNRKLFANTTLVYNDYQFGFNGAQNDFQVSLFSGIRDVNVKTDFDFFASTKHKVKFGAIYTHHKFTPSLIEGRSDSTSFKPNNENIKYANEAAVYIQDDWDVSSKLKVNLGLRWGVYQQVGPYTIYEKDQYGNNLDSTVYGTGKPIKTYNGFEPRITMRYALNDATSIKASVTRNYQYIHLVSNAGTTLPTDLWVPSTYRVQPQVSWLYSIGYFRNFKDNTYETSLEVYYKDMQNQIEYREGYTPNTLRDAEVDFVFGKGWSYGAELFLNKTKGRLTGWLGYTLSWTWRKFPQLNEGDKFPAKFDRRNDLSLVATYELNKKWKLSGVFVYGTGNATTIPERFYIISGVLTQEYSKLNSYRLSSYHRMDVSAIYTPNRKPNRKLKSSWVFSVYNIYSRLNPYFIYFDQTGSAYDGSLKIEARQVSLFPIIPAVTWNFKF